MIIKTTFSIDGELYKALFLSYEEELDFLVDSTNDGDDIYFVERKEVTIADVLADDDFRDNYKIEIIGLEVNPEMVKTLKKVDKIEMELKKMHIL